MHDADRVSDFHKVIDYRVTNMPGGVVFLVCIPTLSYEHELVFGMPLKRSKRIERNKSKLAAPLKVDLRLKEAKTRTQLLTIDNEYNNGYIDDNDENDVGVDVGINSRQRSRGYTRSNTPVFVSMETVERKYNI